MKHNAKTFGAMTAAGMLVLTLGACGSAPSSSSSDATTAAAATQAETQKSDFAVTIDGCEKGTNYEGKPCVSVTYTFTNNSDEAACMATSVITEVYQGDVQVDLDILDDSDGKYTDLLNNSMNKVKPGGSIQCMYTYAITDDSDVEVNCYDFASLDRVELASKTFTIK